MAIEYIEIAESITRLSKRIEDGVNKLHKYAVAAAETERDYRLELGKEIVKLRIDKVQATLIPDIARSNCSNLKFKRDLADEELKVMRDMLRALQSELSSLQTLYSKQTSV